MPKTFEYLGLLIYFYSNVDSLESNCDLSLT